MTDLLACPRCEGLIPASHDHCPHCERRRPWRRLAETTVGSALAMTLMACYGASYAMREPPPPSLDETCAGNADSDGDGYCNADCDDANRQVHPGAEDVPGDGIDQDCDGEDAVGNVVLEQDGEDGGEPSSEQQMAEPQ